jgi:hypothetical protein
MQHGAGHGLYLYHESGIPAMSDTTTSTNTLVHLPETFTFHFHPIPDWMKEKGQLYPAIIRKLLSCLTNV